MRKINSHEEQTRKEYSCPVVKTVSLRIEGILCDSDLEDMNPQNPDDDFFD